jgi:cell division protein ZipA
MTQLRWVLLALGVLIIVAVYLRSRGLPQKALSFLKRRRRAPRDARPRFEPVLGDGNARPGELDTVTGKADVGSSLESAADTPEPEPEPEPTPEPEQPVESVVTLRLIPREGRMSSNRVILALRAAGLRHGRYGIFHRHASELDDEPLFSVASLTEPGSFDLSKLSETTIAGVSFFMVLPGTGDPVDRFDQMVATARELARELGSELLDEKGSSWSIQRERYVREEVIEYRHSLERSSSF